MADFASIPWARTAAVDFQTLGDLGKTYHAARQQGTRDSLSAGVNANDQMSLANLARRAAAAGDMGYAAQAATLHKSLAAPETTDEIKEYKLAQAQGFKGSFFDFKSSLKRAGATNVQTNVNAAVNPVLKGVSDRFNEGIERSGSIRNQIESIHEARAALDDGAITGAFAEPKLLLSKAAGMFGLDQKQATNTEVLRSAIGAQVLEKAKALGANPSNADREYIAAVVGGKIDLNEAAIRRILDMQERWGRASIKRTNAIGQGLLRAYPNELGRVGGMLNVEEPASYDDWRKARKSAPDNGQNKTGTGVPWRIMP